MEAATQGRTRIAPDGQGLNCTAYCLWVQVPCVFMLDLYFIPLSKNRGSFSLIAGSIPHPARSSKMTLSYGYFATDNQEMKLFSGISVLPFHILV